MPNIAQQAPGPASAASSEAKAVRTLVAWRRTDKAALADKQNRNAQRAEYRARNELRGAADDVDTQAGQS